MSSLVYNLLTLYVVFFLRNSVAMTRNSSFPRTSYTYYLDSGLPSTWYNNNSVTMDGWKMRVLLLIQDYSRSLGFYCGFYSEGSSDFYSLAVVAVGGGGHDVVWSTKGDYIVRENASLQLTRDEGLILREAYGYTVWSANTSSKPVVGMNLTEAGNLVLFGDEGAVLWQSFDHPEDTLLIRQRLYEGQNLVPSFYSSKLGRGSPFFATLTPAANFSAFFNTSDGRFLMYYQLALDNNSRNRSGLQYEEAEQKKFVVNLGTSKASNHLEYIVFMKMDQGGCLRTYWYDPEGSGTDIVDMVTQECQNSPGRYLLTEVRDIIYSNSNNADVGLISVRTVNECKKACLHNCSCTAVVFTYSTDVSDGKCYVPSEIYSTRYNSTGQSNFLAFIKVLNPNGSPEENKPEVMPSSWTRRHRNKLTIIAASTTVGVTIILLILMCLVMLRKNQEEEVGDENLKQVPGMPLQFSYEAIRIATENFKEILGSGGFGSVFKGVLADGTRIAVKRLDKVSQGMREFLAEVETIGSLHHFNLVRLVGFCAEKSCRLLVYEYMTNGSLDSWIFNPDQACCLDWQTRKKIILDIAKGLAYLHEECRQKIIHLDIKPHNILLDENFNAKLSDFGLAKLINRDESQVLTTMRGTPGYLAPEWKELRVTVKVDVYSFGIVILEIISKRRNVDSSRSESSFHLLKMLQKKAEEDQIIDIVEDFDEEMQNNREEVVKMVRVGAWCLQNDLTKRPSMSTVVKVLEGLVEVDPDINYTFSHAMAFASVANDHITVAPVKNTPGAPPPSLPSRHRKKLAQMMSASAAGGLIIIVLIVLIYIVVLQENGLDNNGEDNLKQVPGMPLRFSFEELEIATENFKETLGCGGFGSVFKGVLGNGTMVAVKRLDKMSHDMREFLAEVETIGSIHHFNLVRLVGFCAEKSCRLLVYEYMSNGSLDNWIFRRDQSHCLDWQTRKKVILDIAKGLAYVHEDCRQKIIHLDVKPHNILLDGSFNAKVSDFGLSKLIERDESQVLIPMRGTPGYLAPELQRAIVTVKADVYSFGIVVLEIVSKRRNVDSSRSESSFHLLEMLQKKAEEDKLIDIVEDLDEEMQNNREEVERMIRTGAWCLQNNHKKRPLMSTVVKVLEGVMEVEPNISFKFSHAMVSASVANDHITVALEASILSAPR